MGDQNLKSDIPDDEIPFVSTSTFFDEESMVLEDTPDYFLSNPNPRPRKPRPVPPIMSPPIWAVDVARQQKRLRETTARLEVAKRKAEKRESRHTIAADSTKRDAEESGESLEEVIFVPQPYEANSKSIEVKPRSHQVNPAISAIANRENFPQNQQGLEKAPYYGWWTSDATYLSNQLLYPDLVSSSQRRRTSNTNSQDFAPLDSGLPNPRNLSTPPPPSGLQANSDQPHQRTLSSAQALSAQRARKRKVFSAQRREESAGADSRGKRLKRG